MCPTSEIGMSSGPKFRFVLLLLIVHLYCTTDSLECGFMISAFQTILLYDFHKTSNENTKELDIFITPFSIGMKSLQTWEITNKAESRFIEPVTLYLLTDLL